MSSSIHWIIALVALAGISCLDYLTGSVFRLEIFYLAPILYITWFTGMEIGVLFSLFSMVVLKLTDLMTGQPILSDTIEVWNVIMNLSFFIIITVLFSKLIAVNKQLEQQATKDALTGIFNRNKFNELLNIETRRSVRYGTPLSLIMIDIDDFKRINDTYGHTVGDYVLKEFCCVIRQQIRETDYFARWGGEEFALLVTNTPENAGVLAEKLRTAVQNARLLDTVTITCSFGVVLFAKSDTTDSFIRKADDCLYRAKSRGRNRVEQVIQVETFLPGGNRLSYENS